ncbi:MAG: tetratricopeptide repeat protein [Bacteroidetes bacterium]|nr:tetratricopeptide repeat protein [Bacteroidota bacterium]
MKKIKLPHPLILIVGIGFLLYARSLSFDYTNFDDNSLIQDNQNYISDISNLADAFRKTVFITGSDVFYRPVETVWFMLNAQFGGTNLFVYHLSALLLHFLAVYFVFLLLRRFNNSEEVSLFLSLIFLVHPVLTQAVVWVPGVVDILTTVFSVSAFLFFLNFIKSRKRKHFVLHILFFALALYTKEISIGIIVVCLFYLHFIEKEKLVSYNKKVFLAGWLVVSAVWFMMRDAALQSQQGKGVSSMISSVAENLTGFILYIGKILLPFNLSVMPVMKDNTFIFGIIALAIIIGVVFISKERKSNWILFSVIWFVIFLLPTFIRTSEFRVHQFYEHRMYLPMVGFLLLATQVDWIKNFSSEKTICRISAPAILLFFFMLTFRHEKTFSDTKLFLDNAIATAPNSSLAHRNMGIYFQDMDDKTGHKEKSFLENAAEEYKKSLGLNPNENDLHNNLGVIYDTWGKKDLAEKEYLAETKSNPANSQAWHNMGVICAERNENEKAEIYFKKAIELHPAASTYQQLALLYKKTGRKQEFEKIVSMLQNAQQGTQNSQNNLTVPNQAIPTDAASLGRQLMQQGKLQEAEKVFLKELSTDSLNKVVLFNLGLIYYSSKRLPDAENVWRKAVHIDSTYTDAYNNLAICLAQQGKNSEAEIVLKKLVSSNPDYADGYFNLANFYARNGRDDNALVYVNVLKKRGITKEQFAQRGIKLSAELEKIFDK